MSEFAVAAIGQDRPGIVAAVSGALLDLDGNIGDSQMSILHGQFAVMLLVEVPDSVEQAELAERLGVVRDELELEAVTVAPVRTRTDPQVGTGAGPVQPTHVVKVDGADTKGIVHSISAALAGLGVDITDLDARLAGSPDAPLSAMALEIALGEAAVDEVEAALRQAGVDLGVEVSLRELDADAR